MNKDEINEISSKMKTMEEMLKKNVFENPLREVQCSIRNDLIEFKSTLIKNLSELDNYMETLKTEQTLNNINGGNCNNESLEQAMKEIAKKDYQILHIARSFDLYEKKSNEENERLRVENTKLNYRINQMERAIQNLENQLKIKNKF